MFQHGHSSTSDWGKNFVTWSFTGVEAYTEGSSAPIVYCNWPFCFKAIAVLNYSR